MRKPVIAESRAPILAIAGALVIGCSAAPETEEAVENQDAGAAIASQVPDTEIFIGELRWDSGQPEIKGLKNISRRAGYDNQPHFNIDASAIYYSSIRDGLQSDIYQYLVSEDLSVPYALTPESEYSPTVAPDAKSISVVRVEADGTQRLWRFAAPNADANLLLPGVEAVGYHAWLSAHQLALFIVAEPARLEIVSLDKGERRFVAENIGRSFALSPDKRALTFVDRDQMPALLVRFDLVDGALAELIAVPDGSEDFAYTLDGGVFMGEGSRLLYWDGEPGTGWMTVEGPFADLPGRITRLAISPDQNLIALVTAPEPPDE